MKTITKELLCWTIAVTAMLNVSSCGDSSPYVSPQTALDYAMDSLYARNYGAYVRSVATENGDTVIPTDVLLMMLRQHVQATEEVKGTVMSCDVVSSDTITDSLVNVFYKLSYSNGTSEVSMQTMQCTNGGWKLRIRN